MTSVVPMEGLLIRFSGCGELWNGVEGWDLPAAIWRLEDCGTSEDVPFQSRQNLRTRRTLSNAAGNDEKS